MEKTVETVAPALTADQKIKALFEQVRQKKLAINTAEKPNWKTSGSFRYSQDSAHNVINIFSETNQEKIVQIYAFLVERSKAFSDSATILGVKKVFTWLQYTEDEWFYDLKTRVNQLQLSAKKKELADLEARLNAVVSPELKAQMEIDAIEELLAD